MRVETGERKSEGHAASVTFAFTFFSSFRAAQDHHYQRTAGSTKGAEGHWASIGAVRMRTKDIRHWVSASNTPVDSPYDSDDEMKPDGRQEVVEGSNGLGSNGLSSLQDWESFLAGVERRLRSSSTRERRRMLEQQLLSLDKDGQSPLSTSQRTELVLLLLSTYSRYQDKESRAAAQKVASLMIIEEKSPAKDNATAQNATRWLQQEVDVVCKPTKEGYFSSSSVQRANLVSWAGLLFHTIAKMARQDDAACSALTLWEGLVGAYAQVYDSIAIDKEHKSALVKNATAAVRRSVRTVSV